VVKKGNVVDDDSDDGEHNKTASKKSESKLNAMLAKCREELDRFIKSQQASLKENLTTVFTNKVLKQMVEKMPTTMDEALTVTGYTEALYNKYKGEEMLRIFKHYWKEVRDERERVEAEKARLKAEKIKKLEEKNRTKTGVQTMASKRNSKTYGLVDDGDIEGNIDYDPRAGWNGGATTSAGGGGGGYKRKATGSKFSGTGKKKKGNTWGGGGAASGSSYFANKGTGGGGGGSSSGKKTFKPKYYSSKKKS
jgi:hypothetical protein